MSDPTTIWTPPGRAFPRPVQAIIIHHSGTRDSETLSWGAIRRFHTESMEPPLDDVGYHAGVELVRDGYEVLVGRPTDRTGAHVKERSPGGKPWNHVSLGFCFVGDYDQEEPPDSLLEVAAQRWLAPMIRRHELTVDALIPHRDLAPYKSCPGERFDMDRLRRVCQRTLDAWR